jgi:hypothetical protein
MTLLLVGFAVAVLGGGEWSIDHALKIDDNLMGVTGLVIALVAGFGGAAALLLAAWRPEAKATE